MWPSPSEGNGFTGSIGLVVWTVRYWSHRRLNVRLEQLEREHALDKERVRIARALAQKAPALVLDEPTTFLDVAHEMAIFELLSSLAHSGLAVLLVSHQLNLVARFADTIVLLNEGRIATSGTPRDVMKADRLESIYGWPVVITHDPAVGAPALVPLRRPLTL